MTPEPAARLRTPAPVVPPGVLCAARVASDTGFAWTFIARLWADLADALASEGVATWVAYPRLGAVPPVLARSAAGVVELDATLDSVASARRTAAFVRGHRIRTAYLTGQPPVSVWFPWLRALGVRRIVTHDHSSGTRTPPRGVRRFLKWTVARIPGVSADTAVAVSDFVARRLRAVALVPAARVRRIWNGVPDEPAAAGPGVHALLGIAEDRPLIVCACRAAPEKGVDVLLRAFDELWARSAPGPSPVLVYVGDGPDRSRLEALRATLASREDIRFTGYRDDAAHLVAGATLAVVPSVWEEAFGLSALEPMAAGRPVVATAVGGIPEIVVDGVTGRLVPPRDASALASAMAGVLQQPARAAAMGAAGRRRVREHFTLRSQVAALRGILRPGSPA